MTPYDILVPLGILLALLGSRMPKRAAIAVCMLAELMMVGINWLTVVQHEFPLNFFYHAQPWIETSAAAILVVWAQRYHGSDRAFFRLMAGLLLISSAISMVYIHTDMTHARYVVMERDVAAVHVAAMLGMSDALGSCIRWIRRSILGAHDQLSRI